MRKCLLGTFRVGSRKSKGWNSRSQAYRICPQICNWCKIQRDTRGAKQRQATLSLVIAVKTARITLSLVGQNLKLFGWIDIWKSSLTRSLKALHLDVSARFCFPKVMSPKFLRKMWKLVTSKFKFFKRVEEVICQVFKSYSSFLWNHVEAKTATQQSKFCSDSLDWFDLNYWKLRLMRCMRLAELKMMSHQRPKTYFVGFRAEIGQIARGCAKWHLCAWELPEILDQIQNYIIT